MGTPRTHRPYLRSVSSFLLPVLLLAAPLRAEGTESLGPAALPLAQGDQLHTVGTTLSFSTGLLKVDLPQQPVRQAILHWEVHSSNPVAVGLFDVLLVGGELVVGARVGGETLVSPPDRPDVFSSSYRADVTGVLDLGAGPNLLTVLGNPARQRSGIALSVVTGDGAVGGELVLHDGHDFALAGRGAPLDTTTPVVFTFVPAAFPRQAVVDLSAAASRVGAPSVIVAQFPGHPVATFVDQIVPDPGIGPLSILSSWFSLPGAQAAPGWATTRLTLTVPAAADALAVQVLSLDAQTGPFAGRPVAEVRWVAAGFALSRSADVVEKQGCTPGFWKVPQHHDAWPAPYAPDDLFVDVFGEDLYPGLTLLDVLTFPGGGVAQAMGRQLVAALLNAASPDVAYPMTVHEVLAAFHKATPALYEVLKDRLQHKNEAGCPLD